MSSTAMRGGAFHPKVSLMGSKDGIAVDKLGSDERGGGWSGSGTGVGCFGSNMLGIE